MFRSVLLPHPTTRRLRLGPVLGWALTAPWRAAAARMRDPARRQAFRGALAPLLMVAQLVAWVGLLVLGFGLTLHATRAGMAPPPAGLGGSIYQAGGALTTLGLSGATAESGPARAVVVAAGFAGLATVTVVATFLLAVQGALQRREVLVLRLAARAGRPPAGLAVLETYAADHARAGLPAFFADWEAWAADVLHSHSAFPILAYFRSTDEDAEWLAALGAVLDAAALAAAALDEEAPDAAGAARLTLAVGARALHDLARQFGLDGAAAPGPAAPEGFGVALGRLARAGWRPAADEAASRAEFERLRAGYAAPLAALAGRLDVMLAGGDGAGGGGRAASRRPQRR